MSDVYTDDLRTFTVDDVFAFCAQINDETERLEIKRQMPSRSIAYTACAFANAEGGLVVVGIDDPKQGQALRYAANAPDIQNQTLLGISSAVNSWVNPGIDFEVVGLGPNATGNTLVLIRVAASLRGPHEFLGNDGRRLPVRRGREIRELGLADISALQSRRPWGDTPVLDRKIRWVMIQPTNNGPDFYFGINIVPATTGRKRVLQVEDDSDFMQIEVDTRGRGGLVHPPLETFHTLADSIYIADRDEPPGPRDQNFSVHKMQFFSDGEMTMRFGCREAITLIDQYCAVLIAGYYAAQQTFLRSGLTSQANVEFRSRIQRDAAREQGVSEAYEDFITVDLARETFAEAFADLIVRMYRTADHTSTRDAVRDTLNLYSNRCLRAVNALPSRWTATP